MDKIKEKRLVVVLGMHRSGTSVITRGLKVLGVELGDKMMPPAEDNNPRGFWEDIDLNALNIEILNYLGIDWHYLSPITSIDVAALRKNVFISRAAELLRHKLDNTPIFGFKDPRIAKLLPFWKEVFLHCKLDVSYILSIRHPYSVADSLFKRDGIVAIQSYILWLGYILSSLTGSIGSKRVVVNYDLIMHSPEYELVRIAKLLHLSVDAYELNKYKSEFLDQSLRHTIYNLNDLLMDEYCPPIVREIYASLLEVASNNARLEDLNNQIVRWEEEYERLSAPLQLVDMFISQKLDARNGITKHDSLVYDFQRANDKIAIYKETVNSLTAVLADIHSSRSWRLLAGIRWYANKVNRVKGIFSNSSNLLHRVIVKFTFIKKITSIWCFQDGKKINGVSKKSKYFRTESIPELQALMNKPHLRITDVMAENELSKDQRENILFISHEASRTGATIFLLEVIRFISEHLNVNCIILLYSGGELENEFRSLGKTILLSNRDYIDPLTLNALNKYNFSLIYSSAIINSMVQSQVFRLGCPILCHVYELVFSNSHYFGEDNLSQIFTTTIKFIAGSKSVERYLRFYKNIPAEQIALAYPFIDIAKNNKLAHQMTISLNIPKDSIVIGAFGTIEWCKGTDLFLEIALNIIKRYQESVYFIWIGGSISDVEPHYLQHDARLMGVDRNVIFTGSVLSHMPYFSKLDIFVLPSREDSFPLVVLDAASLGIPIVCYDGAGEAPEFVENDAGMVVEHSNVNQMADALIKLMQDDSLRKKMGKRAREKVMERHDYVAGGERIVELIRPYLNNINRKDN